MHTVQILSKKHPLKWKCRLDLTMRWVLNLDTWSTWPHYFTEVKNDKRRKTLCLWGNWRRKGGCERETFSGVVAWLGKKEKPEKELFRLDNVSVKPYFHSSYSQHDRYKSNYELKACAWRHHGMSFFFFADTWTFNPIILFCFFIGQDTIKW